MTDGCYRRSPANALVLGWWHRYREEIALPVIVFVVRKRDAEEIADSLREAGLRAVHIHSEVDRKVRAAAQQALQAGRLDIAVATDSWSTGIDIPALRGVVMARGGSAPVGLKQRAGRAVRRDDGKPGFIVWDLVKDGDEHVAARVAAYQDGGYHVVDEPEVGHPPAHVPQDPLLEQLLTHKPKRHPSGAVTPAGKGDELIGWAIEQTNQPMRWFYRLLGWFLFLCVLAALCK